tara:strand:- start:3773 stop:5011 length:1239 start_codon:yes stop_codon:yes gene_type:complete
MKGVSDNSTPKKGPNNSNRKLLKKPIQVLQLNKKESFKKAEETKLPKPEESKGFQNIESDNDFNQLSRPEEIFEVSKSKEISEEKHVDFDQNNHYTSPVKPNSIEEDIKNFSFERTVDDFDFDEDQFLNALNENEPIGLEGETIKGKVIALESDGLYVDIGGKAPGFLPKKESGIGVILNFKEKFPIGLEIEVLVIKEQNADGMVTVSARALILRKSWENVRKTAKEGKIIDVLINGFNRGGLTCDIDGLRGFIPRSQLENGSEYQSLLKKIIKVAFIEVNPETRKLVLSEKKATLIDKFKNLNLGQLIEGKVLAVKPYGFFVDLGGFSGLLHQSSITKGSIRNLREVFREGEIVKALINEIDLEKGRIGLDTSLLENSPGELLIDKEKVFKEASERAIKAQSLFENINTKI